MKAIEYPLEIRLECLRFIQKSLQSGKHVWVCFAMAEYFKVTPNKIKSLHVYKILPELFELREIINIDIVCHNGCLWYNAEYRVKAVDAAIEEVLSKIEIEQKNIDNHGNRD